MRQLRIHAGHVRCVAYSPDGRHLATASNDYSVRVIEAATGKTVVRWANLGGIMQTVAFHPGGRHLAFGGQSTSLYVADWTGEDTTQAVLEVDLVELASVTCLSYTPDGRTLLCGTGDRILHQRGSLLVIDTEPLRLRSRMEVRAGVQHLAVGKNGNEAVIGCAGFWYFLSPPDWMLGTPRSRGRTVSAVTISPDGGAVAVADGYNVYVPRLGGKDAFMLLRGHRGKVTTLAFTPDGQGLLSGSWDRTVRVWSPSTGQQKAALDWERGKVQYVAVAPDGMTAAAACDKGVVIWDLD